MQMILVPGPARVIRVFICLGVRFCASSMMRYLFMKVRPRMKFMLLTLMRLRTKSLVAARPHSPAPPVLVLRVKNSRLSSSAPIQGFIFSSSVPGKKPMSSPTLTVARVMMISV